MGFDEVTHVDSIDRDVLERGSKPVRVAPGKRAEAGATPVRLRGEFPRGMDHVQHDDRVGRQLHENDVRQPVHDEFVRALNSVAFPDACGERGEPVDRLGDSALDQFGRARACFRVIVSDDFGEVVQRLGGPEDLHPLLGLTRQFRLDAGQG